ncbi:interferon-induced, double-stranded RNA-activated protein kinase isoform X2 [Mustelus asterias]
MATPGSALHNNVEELQLYANKNNEHLTWESKMDGPSHNPVFTFWAKIGDKTFPEAHGKTKKEAKYNAAKMALEDLNIQQFDMTQSISPAGMGNYISKLNEYGQKKDIQVDYSIIQMGTGLDHVQKFSVKVIMDKKEYPIGYGRSKQEAKREAARLAYEEIFQNALLCKSMSKINIENEEEPKSNAEGSVGQNPQRLTEDQTDQSEKRNEDFTSPLSTDGISPDTNSKMIKNPIGRLNEHCQKNSLTCKDVVVDRCGPSHAPKYTVQYVIGDETFPSASGENKQKAKQNAAILALLKLKILSEDELSRISDDDLSSRRSSENSDGLSSATSWATDTAPTTPRTDTTGGSKPKRRLAPTFSTRDVNRDCTTSQTNGTSGEDKASDMTELNVPRIDGFSGFTEIGRGAFGCVYKAKNTVDKKYYAIKEVSLRDEKTKREAEALAKVEHKNIVRYHTSWIGPSLRTNNYHKKSLFIQMELYEKNLKEWIVDPANNNPEKKEVALSIFCQLLDGVVYIHEEKMVHRDLKIGDFGLVKTLDDQESLTKDIGTPHYMSPEQHRLEVYDHKVDIFALGLIFFELLWIQVGTVTEKSKEWNNIRSGRFPLSFINAYNTQSFLIRKMLSETASERPEAEQVKRNLESDGMQEPKTI